MFRRNVSESRRWLIRLNRVWRRYRRRVRAKTNQSQRLRHKVVMRKANQSLSIVTFQSIARILNVKNRSTLSIKGSMSMFTVVLLA